MRSAETIKVDCCWGCRTSNVSATKIHIRDQQPNDYAGLQNNRPVAVYFCDFCGVVIGAYGRSHSMGHGGFVIDKILPEPPVKETINDLLPVSAVKYLEQARDSLKSPDLCVLGCASAVDEMLKGKGYKSGNLNARIKKAVKDHVITPDMEKWAHQVRLEANDVRHADEENPHKNEKEAMQCYEFAKMLGHFLYVLPTQVTKGIKDTAPPKEPDNVVDVEVTKSAG